MQKLNTTLETETLIIGGGIAGIVTALELVQAGRQVMLVEKQQASQSGGLARWAFGGMALVGTELQQRMGISDTPQRALADWRSFAGFSQSDFWPKAWADFYVNHSNDMVYQWLKKKGFEFMPAVNWVERGLHGDGNSLPRYHVLWGTGQGLVEGLLEELCQPKFQTLVSLRFACQASTIEQLDDGFQCLIEPDDGETYRVKAKNLVVASGGINGSVERVQQNWPKDQGPMPADILNGASPDADGQVHDEVSRLGGQLTHLDKMWNYAAGIAHPKPHFPGHGLSLIPCKSALWVNALGERIGPMPLITGFDTNDLCRQVNEQPYGYTWHVLNKRIAMKELAISGSEHNPNIRDKRKLSFFRDVLFGNQQLIQQMLEESDDFICADSVSELTDKMNQLTGNNAIKAHVLQQQLDAFDAQLAAKPALQNDDQIRRINHARQWRPDRLRTCKPSPIQIPKNGPLIAIRLRFISRKSLGGIQTNLQSQVLDDGQTPIPGLYSVGEAAGFGGGGISGRRSLEGTFLSSCILTARQAAKHIIG
ncbi:FAD-binding dehydrogenase [Paraferrimonas haliotis]|uniref:FAD-binding dehydrogenase n=1 Tax=Paraferrimonas haliotis TaxID=2013866 RepID=A0AA37WXE8_9GAMM|nr:FAD-binding dehydrogenase [Paraferrimonas haliotis]GLS84272.1 FAD-binding dehydrogenase [Paraferrimonas haliotis]